MSATPYLVELVLRSSLLLILLWAAAMLVRTAGASAAMRHSLWLFGIGALLILPPLSLLAPPLPLSALPEIVLSAPAVSAPSPLLGTAGDAAAPLDWAVPVQTAYAAVALILLLRLAAGWCLLSRLWRRAQPLDKEGHWSRLVADLASPLAIGRPVELRIASEAVMPMTWGLFRPRILLPAHAVQWTEERCGLVLMHELAHVARGDSASRIAASVACALYWFHPMVWHSAKLMRLEQEHACDDLVLSQGARACDYAQDLLDAARGFRAPALSTPCAAMVRTSELERRLVAIVDRRERSRSNATFLAGSAGTMAAATLLIATAVPDSVRELPPSLAQPAQAWAGPTPQGPVPKKTAPQAVQLHVRTAERLTDAPSERARASSSVTRPVLPDVAPATTVPSLPAVPAVPQSLAVPQTPAVPLVPVSASTS